MGGGTPATVHASVHAIRGHRRHRRCPGPEPPAPPPRGGRPAGRATPPEPGRRTPGRSSSCDRRSSSPQGKGAAHVPAPVLEVDGAHRLVVDDEVVRPVMTWSTTPSTSRATTAAGSSGGWSSTVTSKSDDTTNQGVPERGWPGWSRLISVTNGPSGTIAAIPGTLSGSVAYEASHRTSAPMPRDPADDGRDRAPPGTRRSPGGVGRHEVGVEVGQIGPAASSAKWVPALVAATKTARSTLPRQRETRQHGLDEATRGEPTAAVADHVEGHLSAPGMGRRSTASISVAFCERVDAQRPVVEADDGVVGGRAPGSGSPPLRCAGASAPNAPTVESKVPWTKSSTRLSGRSRGRVSASERRAATRPGRRRRRGRGRGRTTSSLRRAPDAAGRANRMTTPTQDRPRSRAAHGRGAPAPRRVSSAAAGGLAGRRGGTSTEVPCAGRSSSCRGRAPQVPR